MANGTATKPWFLSKTVIGIVIAGIATALTWLNKPDIAANVQAESTGIVGLIEQIVIIVGLVIAMFGRLTAKKKLTK